MPGSDILVALFEPELSEATRVSFLGLTFFDQRGVFNQAAKLFLCELFVCAVFGEWILHHFKVYAEALQFDDTNIDGFGFPDLSLFQSHRCVVDVVRRRVEVCLLSGLGALHRAGCVFGAVELPVGEREIIPRATEARLDGNGFFEEADRAFEVSLLGCE